MNDDVLHSFVSVDTETTGLYPMYGDKIIQLSAVKVIDDQITDEFNVYINPGEGLENNAYEINSISDDMLTSSPCFREILPQFRTFISNLPWVGHNISFDLKFLQNEGLHIEKNKLIFTDTLTLARRVFGPRGNKLWQLEKRFNIKNEHQHNSLDDARATVHIYKALRGMPQAYHVDSKSHRNYRQHTVAQAEDRLLKGAKIVFSGHFEGKSREELRNLVEKHGGKSPTAVSRVTDYLVLGIQTSKTKNPKHSRKELSAIKNKVPIISIDDFYSLIGGK